MKIASLLFPLTSAASEDESERGWSPIDSLTARKTQSGERVSPESSMQLSAYFACIRNVSEDIGKLPLILYRHDGKAKARETNHPLYRLLHDDVSGEMSSMTFRETLTHWALGWGNGYAEIVRDQRGAVVELCPIHPSRVTVKRIDGALAYLVRGDVPLGVASYGAVRLRPDEIFHLHGLGDGLTGYSVARLAAESIGLTMAAQTFGAAFFGNGASMSGVLEHPGKLDEPARKNLRETWQGMHGGAKNSAKTAILEEGMKYSRVGIPPEEAQFLQCVVPETLVSMADGRRVEAQNIVVGDEVVGWDNGPVVARVAAVGLPPIKPLVRVRTSRGRDLTASTDHPCLAKKALRTAGGRPDNTPAQWTPAGDLKIGQYVRVALRHVFAEGGDFDRGWFYGAMVGNGCVRSSGSAFSNIDPGVTVKMGAVTAEYGGGMTHLGGCDYTIKSGWRCHGGGKIQQLLNDPAVHQRADLKRVPESVLDGGPESWAGFMSGYMDTDGTVSHDKAKQPQVAWSSVSRDLLGDCQHILAMLGINSGIYLASEGGRRVVVGIECDVLDMHQLCVCGRVELEKLAGILRPSHTEKRNRLNTFRNSSPTRYRPENWLYDRVVSVESVGDGQTTGIEIEGCHTFVTGGIVTHNTREFQNVEICRWFRMPPHKIQELGRATFTNIESQGQEYVTDTLMAWANRWEHEIRRKLIPVTEPDLFAELLFAALLRGDQNARANFFRTMINIGAMSPNEVRALENLNPGEASLDEYYMQSNMLPLSSIGTETARTGASSSGFAPAERSPPQDGPATEAAAREDQVAAQVVALRPVFLDAADRVLRNEVLSATRAAAKYKGDAKAFGRWADAFYSEQREFMVQALATPVQAAATLAAHVRGATVADVDLDAFAADHAARSRAACLASAGAALLAENTAANLADQVIALAIAKDPAHVR